MNDGMKAIGVLALGLSVSLGAASAGTPESGKKGTKMSEKAKGTFEIKVTPVAGDGKESVASGRLTADKTFEGDLVGTSKGEMWTADTRAREAMSPSKR